MVDGVFDIMVKTIVRGVAVREGVPAHAILGPSPRRSLVRARHAAIRQIASLAPHAGPTKIARALALDHTTVSSVLGRCRRKPPALRSPIPCSAGREA